MVNAILEVSKDGIEKGNVELKVYNPSNNKKKGATIELRKMSGHDYSHVESLRNMIEAILDGLLSGEEIETVLKNLKEGSKASKIVIKPKLFTCQVCNFQTKVGPALKTHVTKTHGNSLGTSVTKSNCTSCSYEAKTKSTLNEHIKYTHKQKIKRPKDAMTCSVENCHSTFSSEDNLKEHKETQHEGANKKIKISSSPSSSPPRKI